MSADPDAPATIATTEPVLTGTPGTGWYAATIHLAAGVDHLLSKSDQRKIQTMRPDRWDSGLVWLCLHRFVFPHLASLKLNEDRVAENEQRWATLCIAMSWCPHGGNNGLRFGEALAHAKYQEVHFKNLLRCESHDTAIFERFIRAARTIGSKRGVSLNWGDASRILFTFDPRKSELLRREIARDYYSVLHRAG
jgi:CRISPR type I-E-associated protein CasB/Cse2